MADLAKTAQQLSARLGVEFDLAALARPADHSTAHSAAASVGRWRTDLSAEDAQALQAIAARLGY